MKQSQTYASNAAKDLTPFVEKAKAELDKLGEQAKASAAAGQAASTDVGIINPDAPSVALVPNVNEGDPLTSITSRDPTTTAAGGELGSGSSTADPSASTSASNPVPGSQSPPVTAAAFFSRLQGQLQSNPNFQSFQHNFSTMQAELKSKVDDFSKIDMAEAQRRAEAAMNQGEKYFKTASSELSDLFGQAVRIVPPEEAGAGARGSRGGAAADKRKKDAAVAAAGRKETLLHRLRSDPAIILVDPAEAPSTAAQGASAGNSDPESSFSAATATHADVREAFAKFCQKVEEEQGGLDGDRMKAKIGTELDNEESGHVLRATFDSLVPSRLPAEAFWTRYFFRVQQIEEDEARRREILEGEKMVLYKLCASADGGLPSGAAQQEEEDFSWDMEDESVSSVAGDVSSPTDIKGKGKAINTSGDAEAQSTPTLGSAATLPVPSRRSEEKLSSSASSDIDDSWGDNDEAPAARAAVAAQATAATRAREQTSETKASTPRNSSEEGTSSSYDMVSAGSSPKLEKKQSASTLKKDSTVASNAEEDEDSDWE